jgi:Rrf2 family protein
MKISTRLRYGARAAHELAKSYGGKPVPIQWIASRQDISSSYLEQLLAKLRNGGIVSSFKGPGGGYKLSQPPEKISILDLETALEGKIALVKCCELEKCDCGREDYCVMKLFWVQLQELMIDYLKSITLQDVLEKEKEIVAKKGERKPRKVRRRKVKKVKSLT